MKGKFILLILLQLNDMVASYKCYFTDLPWAKNCSKEIHENYGAKPACLWAVVIDRMYNIFFFLKINSLII